VEIATARWFGRGTRVRDFRIPGAVLRPVSTFADNSSRRINGETWSVQRWRFRVFPRESGRLTIPQLRVFVSVNTETDGTVEGELTLPSTTARIVSPPGTENLDIWVATPTLSIEQHWEGSLDAYLPGDAITRTRSFVVEDAPAMMLQGSETPQIPGLSFYQAPANVVDESHRGTLTGKREERMVITFEAPGHYQIPGLDYVWFNTGTGRLETISLPALELEVLAAEAMPRESAKRSAWLPGTPLILGSGAAVLLMLLLWLSRHSELSKRARTLVRRRLLQQRSRSAYLQALQQNNSALCLQLLYQQLAQSGSQRQLQDAVRAHAAGQGRLFADAEQTPEHSLRLLLEHGYGQGDALPGHKAAAELWKAVSEHSKDSDNETSSPLQLNPGAS
jgi:hypothetical protein